MDEISHFEEAIQIIQPNIITVLSILTWIFDSMVCQITTLLPFSRHNIKEA